VIKIEAVVWVSSYSLHNNNLLHQIEEIPIVPTLIILYLEQPIMTTSPTTDDQQQSNAIRSDNNTTVSTSQAKDSPMNEDQHNNNTTTSQLTPPKEASKQTTTADNSTSKSKQQKIKVHLVAVGSAPILKKSKFLMNRNDKFAVANTFLRKILKLQSTSVFLYINAAFVPAPDELLGNLYDCFNVRGELVIHYSLQEAWG